MKTILSLNIYWLIIIYIFTTCFCLYIYKPYGAIVGIISIISVLYFVINANILKHKMKNDKRN